MPKTLKWRLEKLYITLLLHQYKEYGQLRHYIDALPVA